MLKTVGEFIEKESLCTHKDKILLAVSGGKDSMVMLDIMKNLGYQLHVAHINHGLRGLESDADQVLVSTVCNGIGIGFSSYTFSHEEIALVKSGNLQEECRKLRYAKLEEFRQRNQCQYIATAHHQDDKVETFFINLLRGSGLRGLSSIPSKIGKVIRPLLCINSEEIQHYVSENKIGYREDASNASDKYLRNNIRHHLITSLKKTQEKSVQSILKSIDNLNDSNSLLFDLIDHWIDTNIKIKGNEIHIPKVELLKIPNTTSMLWHFLCNYGLNSSQCHDIMKSIDSIGAVFYSPTHTLLIDREVLILRNTLKLEQAKELLIPQSEGKVMYNDNTYKFEQVEHIESYDNPNIIYLDQDKLQLPLKLRPVQKGDLFRPFGMKGRKKNVNKYLSDLKLSRFEKGQKLVLTSSNDEIVWIIGHRIAHGFGVSENTTCILKVSIQD